MTKQSILRDESGATIIEFALLGPIVLGLMMSSISQLGWTVDEIMMGRTTSWLGWHAVFALFGAVAPLLALLAQPHRGPRERVTATTAVDLAGIAVLTGFLYSYFVVSADLSSIQSPSTSLVLLSELQQLLVVIGVSAAALLAHRSRWGSTYRRLAMGQLVGFAMLSLSNLEIWQASYRAAGVLDVMWILPFSFYPWAAAGAPSSADAAADPADAVQTPSRPWVIFCGLVLVPVLDAVLRMVNPVQGLGGFRDLTMAVTVVSVLPLLMARLVVERGELDEMGIALRKTDAKLQLLAAAIEHADELVAIIGRDERIEHANEAFCRALGYEGGVPIGLDNRALLAEEARQPYDETVRRIDETGLWRGTYLRKRKNGTTFPSAAA